MTGFMSGQTLGTELSFDIPVAVDNSKEELTVVKTPSDIDSPYNFTEDTQVSYVFSDAAGNSVECTFRVEIQGMGSLVSVFIIYDFDVTQNLHPLQVIPRLHLPRFSIISL